MPVGPIQKCEVGGGQELFPYRVFKSVGSEVMIDLMISRLRLVRSLKVGLPKSANQAFRDPSCFVLLKKQGRGGEVSPDKVF